MFSTLKGIPYVKPGLAVAAAPAIQVKKAAAPAKAPASFNPAGFNPLMMHE